MGVTSVQQQQHFFHSLWQGGDSILGMNGKLNSVFSQNPAHNTSLASEAKNCDKMGDKKNKKTFWTRFPTQAGKSHNNQLLWISQDPGEGPQFSSPTKILCSDVNQGCSLGLVPLFISPEGLEMPVSLKSSASLYRGHVRNEDVFELVRRSKSYLSKTQHTTVIQNRETDRNMCYISKTEAENGMTWLRLTAAQINIHQIITRKRIDFKLLLAERRHRSPRCRQ